MDPDLADLEAELVKLRSEHRALDDRIGLLVSQGVVDQLKVQRLKREKLAIKDRIAWIEDQLNPDIIA